MAGAERWQGPRHQKARHQEASSRARHHGAGHHGARQRGRDGRDETAARWQGRDSRRRDSRAAARRGAERSGLVFTQHPWTSTGAAPAETCRRVSRGTSAGGIRSWFGGYMQVMVAMGGRDVVTATPMDRVGRGARSWPARTPVGGVVRPSSAADSVVPRRDQRGAADALRCARRRMFGTGIRQVAPTSQDRACTTRVRQRTPDIAMRKTARPRAHHIATPGVRDTARPRTRDITTPGAGDTARPRTREIARPGVREMARH